MQKASVKLHSSADELLGLIRTYTTTAEDEIASNVILAHALDLESVSETHQGSPSREVAAIEQPPVDEQNGLKPSTARWLTLWGTSEADNSESEESLALVVSCLDWCVGSYPLFLWSPRTEAEATAEGISESMPQLCKALLDTLGRERVFSMFGRADLVLNLTGAWSRLTGKPTIRKPIYVAYLSWCSQETLKSSSKSVQNGHRIRLASPTDIDAIAVLCKGFSEESVWYKLSTQKAQEEARSLVLRRRVWLYESREGVVSICAAARQSKNVSAITKVYTAPAYRQNGYAEILVREVAKTLLSTRSHVMLYVGVDNPAQNVYDRVGFVGLDGQATENKLENALEVGFEGSAFGHW